MVENIEEVVRQIIKTDCYIKKINEVDLKESLQDLGINSASFMKVVVSLEKRFGIEFEDQDLTYQQFETLQDIINCVTEKVKLGQKNIVE